MVIKLDLKKNEIYTAEITGMTAEGNGVCRVKDIAVFVPFTAVGDYAEIRIVKVAKNYAFGKIENLLISSVDRQSPDCTAFGKCGGCVYRHINYEAEKSAKAQRVKDAITRIGGLSESVMRPLIGAEQTDGYRNKVQLPFVRDTDGHIRIGFFAPRSHRVVPLKSCHLQSPTFDKAIKIVLRWANEENIEPYNETTHTGILRHLYLRHAMKTNELMVCIVICTQRLKGEKHLVQCLCEGLDNLKTVVLNINTERTNVITGKKNRVLYGSGAITDELCGLKFKISPLSFYQVNRDQAEKLYQKACEYADLKPHETLLDLYCGTGTIGLTMARKVKKLIGVEIVSQAIEDAKKNAAENGITNAEFFCADAAQAAVQLAERGEKPDCIIIDPPRKGCDVALIQTIVQMSPSRIVYVSCDPGTLARDLKLFCEQNYNIEEVTPIDLFPRTAHVETVVLMSKIDK